MEHKKNDRVISDRFGKGTIHGVYSDGSLLVYWDSCPNRSVAYSQERAKEFRPLHGFPVREVTRTEIVPGEYGLLTVYYVGKSLRIEFVRSNGSADELEKAAEHLIAIAKAMRNED